MGLSGTLFLLSSITIFANTYFKVAHPPLFVRYAFRDALFLIRIMRWFGESSPNFAAFRSEIGRQRQAGSPPIQMRVDQVSTRSLLGFPGVDDTTRFGVSIMPDSGARFPDDLHLMVDVRLAVSKSITDFISPLMNLICSPLRI